MKLSYNVTGTGWADALISHENRQLEIPKISYISDAPKDLFDAANKLATGAERACFLWHHEPGEHRWIIVQTKSELNIRILWFKDAWEALPDDLGTEVFQCKCPLTNFLDEVAACGEGLLAEHGEEGYRDMWCSEFPEEEFGRLKWLITQRRKQTK